MQEFWDIAKKDLFRLEKKYKIGIIPLAPTYLVLWRHDLSTWQYSDFKYTYLEAEDCLCRWLQSHNKTDCWLTVGRSLTEGRSDTWLQFAVHKEYEHPGT